RGTRDVEDGAGLALELIAGKRTTSLDRTALRLRYPGRERLGRAAGRGGEIHGYRDGRRQRGEGRVYAARGRKHAEGAHSKERTDKPGNSTVKATLTHFEILLDGTVVGSTSRRLVSYSALKSGEDDERAGHVVHHRRVPHGGLVFRGGQPSRNAVSGRAALPGVVPGVVFRTEIRPCRIRCC